MIINDISGRKADRSNDLIILLAVLIPAESMFMSHAEATQ